MVDYRIDLDGLWAILEGWDKYLPQKVHLIGCGGTALTLQNIKQSTKDVDFIVPREKEYDILVGVIKRLGYRQVTGSGWSRDEGFVFDLFRGNRIYTTELLDPPLKRGNNIRIRELKRLYVGALNDYDLITSKMFRGSTVDIEDCLDLIRSRGSTFDLQKLKRRYEETAKYDVNPERMLENLGGLLRRLRR